MPDVSNYRPEIKSGLILICISLFFISIIRPQFGSKLENIKRKIVKIMIAVDISNSMLATDLPTLAGSKRQKIGR